MVWMLYAKFDELLTETILKKSKEIGRFDDWDLAYVVLFFVQKM